MSKPVKPVPADVTEIAVPFSTRISLDARRTIERIHREQDLSIRQVIELAIADRWGNQDDAPLKHAVGE